MMRGDNHQGDGPLGNVVDTHSLGEGLSALLESKSRGLAETVDAHLWQVGDASYLPSSKTTLRIHLLKKDANGNVRVRELAMVLASKIVDYCIPRSKIERARNQDARTGSTDAMMQLGLEAKNLFSTVSNSGEGGELLLYFLLETVLRIPQILCKMPLKTNSRVHYHGVDGVHAKTTDSETLAVYWGESKLYADPIQGIRECLKSIRPFLVDDGTDRSERDRLLVRDNIDLNNPEIEAALKLFFDHTTEESSRLQYRAACLVGFSLDNYPNHADGNIETAILGEITKWSDEIGKKVKDHKIAHIEIEFFCVPFPDVSTFRRQILESLGISVTPGQSEETHDDPI